MPVDNQTAKIQGANLPPYVLDTTLVRDGFQMLRDIVASKAFRKPQGLESYTIVPQLAEVKEARAVRATTLLAKEILLMGTPVYYITLAGFLREVRLQDYSAARDPINPVLDRIGTGYIAISEMDNPEAWPSPSIWQEGQDLLMSHVSRGGGLILGTGANVHGDGMNATHSFKAMADGFTVLAVV